MFAFRNCRQEQAELYWHRDNSAAVNVSRKKQHVQRVLLKHPCNENNYTAGILLLSFPKQNSLQIPCKNCSKLVLILQLVSSNLLGAKVVGLAKEELALGNRSCDGCRQPPSYSSPSVYSLTGKMKSYSLARCFCSTCNNQISPIVSPLLDYDTSAIGKTVVTKGRKCQNPMAHGQPVVHHETQVPLCGAPLQQVIPQPVLMHAIISSLGARLYTCSVKPHLLCRLRSPQQYCPALHPSQKELSTLVKK